MMAHARSLRLDFQDVAALTIWFDQGHKFLEGWREQIIALKNMGQARE